MKKITLSVILLLLIAACQKGSDSNTAPTGNTNQGGATTSKAQKGPAVGDKVLYLSNTGQRFYEATVVSIDDTRAKLTRDGETVESDVTDVYPLPKADAATTIKAGEIVAARFGQTSIWPGAEVVKVSDGSITLKWLSTGKVEEVPAENILGLPPATAAKVKESFTH